MNIFGGYLVPVFLTLFMLMNCPSAVLGFTDDATSLNINPVIIILFMFFGLCIGILTVQINSRMGELAPYTVVIFLLGFLFSLLLKFHQRDVLDNSIRAWDRIDSELLLFIFLPPLIFGEAMNLKWHHVEEAIPQSLVLAGPGVLIGAALMAVASKYLLPYSWSWNLALTFGSILSATDPVAVVALLKSSGASPKLTMLIVGESLLNDGTAMVLFTLFFNFLKGTVYTAGEIVAFFFNAALGSVVFGMVCGLIVVRWLRSANRPLKEEDVTVQIAVTICCAYLIFFIAQYLLEQSGVLACCGAGAMISWLGPPVILSHESMHNVWSIIEWMGNTLIFLLAGLIIGHRSINHVQPLDVVFSVILYLVLMLIRVFVISLFFPLLSSKSHKCTLTEAIFISWAGIRGALAMALALLVENAQDADVSAAESSRVFFFVGMIAAMSLLLNGTLSKLVLKWLRLIDDNAVEKEMVVDQIRKQLHRKMTQWVELYSSELREEDLEDVKRSCTMLRETTEGSERVLSRAGSQTFTGDFNPYLNSIPEETADWEANKEDEGYEEGEFPSNRRSFDDLSSPELQGFQTRKRAKTCDPEVEFRALSANQLLSRSRRTSSLLVPDLLAYVRGIFLEIVRVKYWHKIEAGELPRLSHSAQYLLYSVDVGKDEVRSSEGFHDWICLENAICNVSWNIRFMSYIDPLFPSWQWTTHVLGRLEARKEKRTVYMLTSFIEAHEHAQKRIHAFIGASDEETYDPSPEEVKIVEESKAAVARAKEMLAQIPQDTIAAIRSKQVAQTLLSKQAEVVKDMVREGLLATKHAEQFLEEISEDASNIETDRYHLSRQHAAIRIAKRRKSKKGARDNNDNHVGKVIDDHSKDTNNTSPLDSQDVSDPNGPSSQQESGHSNHGVEYESISVIEKECRNDHPPVI